MDRLISVRISIGRDLNLGKYLKLSFKDFIKLKRECLMLSKSFTLPWLIVCRKTEIKKKKTEAASTYYI